jgi:hypothetical protein
MPLSLLLRSPPLMALLRFHSQTISLT